VPMYQVEKRFKHAWGHSFWVLLNVSLVRDDKVSTALPHRADTGHLRAQRIRGASGAPCRSRFSDGVVQRSVLRASAIPRGKVGSSLWESRGRADARSGSFQSRQRPVRSQSGR
jgi:hypothetical protein